MAAEGSVPRRGSQLTPGTRCLVQFVPFQRSATSAEPLRPTAVHARHEEQDTEFRNVFAGAGVRSVVHFRPFHRSASTRKPVAETLVITGGVVEKHIASIFAKLGLPPSDSDNRRVIAAIKFLAG